MFKHLATIATLVFVLLYSMSVPVIWGMYYLQADVVAAAHCVNPDVPSCHGKCHVTKLASKQQTDNQTPPLLEVNPEKPLLYVLEAMSEDSAPEMHSTCAYITTSSTLLGGYPSNVFHPPALLS